MYYVPEPANTYVHIIGNSLATNFDKANLNTVAHERCIFTMIRK